jgi:hypothetical protein
MAWQYVEPISYKHLESRPYAWRRQLWPRGRTMTVDQMLAAIRANHLNPEPKAGKAYRETTSWHGNIVRLARTSDGAMIWTTPQGHVLLEGKAHPIELSVSGQGIRLPTGAVIHSASEYCERTRSGDVVTTYSEPLTCALDDYLYVSNIHVVVDTALHRFFWAEESDGGTLEDTVLLRDLTPYAGENLPFDPEQVGSSTWFRAAITG